LQCILCRQNGGQDRIAAGQQTAALDVWIYTSFGEQAIKNERVDTDEVMHAPIVMLHGWPVNTPANDLGPRQLLARPAQRVIPAYAFWA
jgi:hypothetical protein